jgi:hypothetical protein
MDGISFGKQVKPRSAAAIATRKVCKLCKYCCFVLLL